MTPFDRITSNPSRMNGQPCVRDLRLTVRRVLEAIALYPNRADLFREYPELQEEDIRQVFRRINSYTVPLNPQEKRHATHQGAFKWFVVGLGETYAQSLKTMGVLSETNLSRMADQALFTEITYAILSVPFTCSGIVVAR